MGKIKRRIIPRDIEQGHECLYRDYFSENPVYPTDIFRRRFRMNRDVFFRIQMEVEKYEPYFVRNQNAAAYGDSADSIDEYVRIGASTALKSLKLFTKTIVEVFGEEYLRSPTPEDLRRLLAQGESRGFPGMLGSIDCMHWTWKNCPTTWHGSLNDINVLEHSTVFHGLTQGVAPSVRYSINGHNYTMGYYLADGIYPKWATFVKSISLPPNPKLQYFATKQEVARKDVERAFGVLQARFKIVRGPTRYYKCQIIAP
ncbi:uncharacterized protein LOC124934845 [Impatiens glandulifera]|uniref:uncharacterized protein LOC124934845 n=1 Tax=Impatiens glandulifera TaxID=253017 RepID=UPI001FB09F2C|nr:uncharacterized protein LOC124934845 [Impatiens glandulifera]